VRAAKELSNKLEYNVPYRGPSQALESLANPKQEEDDFNNLLSKLAEELY
jgi:hypothetical protein